MHMSCNLLGSHTDEKRRAARFVVLSLVFYSLFDIRAIRGGVTSLGLISYREFAI
jgi:hypothetical protein